MCTLNHYIVLLNAFISSTWHIEMDHVDVMICIIIDYVKHHEIEHAKCLNKITVAFYVCFHTLIQATTPSYSFIIYISYSLQVRICTIGYFSIKPSFDASLRYKLKRYNVHQMSKCIFRFKLKINIEFKKKVQLKIYSIPIRNLEVS